MTAEASGVQTLVPGIRDSRAIDAGKVALDTSVTLLESTGEPGQVHSPAQPLLVLSQASGHSFRFECDLGAGRFSGRGLPLDFIVVPPDTPALCRIDDPHQLRFLGIPPGVARQLLGRASHDPLDFGVLHARHNRDPYIAHAFDLLWRELALGDPAARLFAESTVVSILARLERLASESSPVPSDAAPRGGLTAWQSARVIDFMRSHLDETPSLPELAGLAGLSPWHFARAFRQSHGVPPHRYLVRLRLERASELLENSRLPVTEIAAMVGYSSQHLARHFRCAMGCSPSQYRRQAGH